MLEEKYNNIRKYLGEEWLKKQFEEIEHKLWVDNQKLRDKISNEPAYFILQKIDELIIKLEKISGFDKWVKEAKNSGMKFKDCLFEIMVFENLYKGCDDMIIKPENHGKFPEALIIKKGIKIYIEAKNLNKIPENRENKVNRLLSNTREKFKLSKGILFIGCFDFFNYQNDEVRIKEEFNELKIEVERKLNNSRQNSRILAVALTNIYIQTDMKKSSLQKYFYLIPRPNILGGFDEGFFREIFDVNAFLIE